LPVPGTTPEIAELRAKYDASTIDWMVVDASGTPKQTLEHCQLGSLPVRLSRPIGTKQQCRHPRNQAVELPPAPDGRNNAAIQPRD
jgi:hypothetical protein